MAEKLDLTTGEPIGGDLFGALAAAGCLGFQHGGQLAG